QGAASGSNPSSSRFPRFARSGGGEELRASAAPLRGAASGSNPSSSRFPRFARSGGGEGLRASAAPLRGAASVGRVLALRARVRRLLPRSMIKYIGSKRTLLPSLLEVLAAFPELQHVADVFAGTSRVGHACKQTGLRVTANDHNAYAHCLAQCYVEADLEDVERDAKRLLRELQGLPGRAGYFTTTFCERSRFFQPHNGARVDAIRDEIERKGLPPLLHAVVLTSLMEAADRVDSTCGLQMAY